MRVAVIGLGEVGSAYASALAGGHDVRGYDPASVPTPPGVERVADLPAAVRAAEFVMVVTAASVSAAVATEAAPHLADHCCYADFTSAAPKVKRRVAEVAGVRAADIAILGPILRHGVRAPLMASGSGASVVAEVMGALGAPVDVLDGEPGDAMAHKLLRSVFMKGLAVAICEAVAAGRAAGHEQWVRDQIAAELAGDGQTTIDRFLTGTVRHAVRRGQEMDDANSYLTELGTPSHIGRAAAEYLHNLADDSGCR